MGSTLTNGIYLPAEGERNCYTGLAANWTALDSLIGGYNAHIGNTTIHVTAEDKETWNGKADNSALTAHTGNTTIHVTAEDKEAWNGKADNSALTAHTGNTTIHVTAEDKQAWNGHIADLVKHVTAEDKAKWDAVTSKADDSAVMHLTGDESALGIKAFIGTRTEFKRSNGDGVILFSNGSFTKGSASNDTINICRKYYGNATSIGSVLGYSSVAVGNNGNKTTYQFYCIDNTAGSTSRTTIQMNYDKSLSGSDAQYINISGSLLPSVDNSYNLGNSTNKWSTINGLNPSSLSLPDLNNGIDISGYITHLDKVVNNYTPPANGWLSIRVKKTSLVHASLMIYQTGGLLSSCETDEFSISGTNLPVIANQNVEIYIYADVLVSAKFYPCLGNV